MTSALQPSSLMIVSWPEGEHNWPKTVFYCKCTWKWQVLHFYLLFKRYELTRLDPAPGASGTAGRARGPGTASRRHVLVVQRWDVCGGRAHRHGIVVPSSVTTWRCQRLVGMFKNIQHV